MMHHPATGERIGASSVVVSGGPQSTGWELDNGQPGGFSPSGVGASSTFMQGATGVLSTAFAPERCEQQVNSALAAFQAQTGRSAVAPAPRVPAAAAPSPPLSQQQQQHQQPMVPAAPKNVAPPMAPAQLTAQQISANQQALQQLNQNKVELPFSFMLTSGAHRKLNLQALEEGKCSPSHNISVVVPKQYAGKRMMVTGIEVHHGQSSSRQQIGVRFGDVDHSQELTFPNDHGASTVQYNALVSTAGQTPLTTTQKAFELTSVVPVSQLMKYGHVRSKEELLKGISVDEVKGTASVPLNTVIGAALQSQGHLSQLQPTVAAKTGVVHYTVGAELPRQLADRIDAEVLQNPRYQKALTNMERFNVTLVPLTSSGKWTDVSELNVEPESVRQTELQRNFNVLVQGTITAVVVPDAPSSA